MCLAIDRLECVGSFGLIWPAGPPEPRTQFCWAARPPISYAVSLISCWFAPTICWRAHSTVHEPTAVWYALICYQLIAGNCETVEIYHCHIASKQMWQVARNYCDATTVLTSNRTRGPSRPGTTFAALSIRRTWARLCCAVFHIRKTSAAIAFAHFQVDRMWFRHRRCVDNG